MTFHIRFYFQVITWSQMTLWAMKFPSCTIVESSRYHVKSDSGEISELYKMIKFMIKIIQK